MAWRQDPQNGYSASQDGQDLWLAECILSNMLGQVVTPVSLINQPFFQESNGGVFECDEGADPTTGPKLGLTPESSAFGHLEPTANLGLGVFETWRWNCVAERLQLFSCAH